MNRYDDDFAKIILAIERSAPLVVEKKPENEAFELSPDPVLLSGLAGNSGTFFVRAILSQLNIDEHHVLKWRLENKYRQYQILNYYAPECMAESIGFSQVLNEKNGVQKIRKLCKNGFFIKATLGHGTGVSDKFDRTDELDEIINSHKRGHQHLEEWMLQKRLNLTEEYRIHTFGKDLLKGLSFNLKHTSSPINFGTEDFVTQILKRLPETLVAGTLIGWDIAVTDTNEYYVIETNITGFHPEFRRGFQTSGFFGIPYYGAVISASLNNYFKNKYNISANSVEKGLLSSDNFYKDFLFYTSIFENKYFEDLRNKTRDTGMNNCSYSGENINRLLQKMLQYFELTDFTKTYLINHQE